MRVPRFLGPLALAVPLAISLAILCCLTPLQPAQAAPPEHIASPSAPPDSPPPSPPARAEPAPSAPAPSEPPAAAPPEPSPAPEPAPAPAAPPSANENPTPTDPGTAGRRISPPPPPADRGPTDPGTAGRRIPASSGYVDDGGDQPAYLDAADDLASEETSDRAAAPQKAAKPPAGEALDVRVVKVEVAVADRSGLPVAGLTEGDFEVLEDGRPVPIADFHAPAALPHVATFYSLGLVSSRGSAGGDHPIAVRVRRRSSPDGAAPHVP